MERDRASATRCRSLRAFIVVAVLGITGLGPARADHTELVPTSMAVDHFVPDSIHINVLASGGTDIDPYANVCIFASWLRVKDDRRVEGVLDGCSRGRRTDYHFDPATWLGHASATIRVVITRLVYEDATRNLLATRTERSSVRLALAWTGTGNPMPRTGTCSYPCVGVPRPGIERPAAVEGWIRLGHLGARLPSSHPHVGWMRIN